MFHNGAQCLCLVGYSLIKNTCTKLSILTPTITPPTPPNQCPGANQIHNGTACVCISGFFMVNNVCRSCPPNSVWNGNLCKCKNGFTLVNGVCVNRSSVVCPANSFNNGLGICICRLKDHRMVNNKCQKVQCGTNFQWNGTQCICDPAIFVQLNNGSCSQRCPKGQFWSQSNNKCIVICGIN